MILPSNREPLIVCKDINVAFPTDKRTWQPVLSHLDLQVDNGNIFTLLGPSGCGKSTLLRVIAGLITPQTGTLLIDGRVVLDKKAEVQSMMSFVFQEASLLPWRNVMENVQLPLHLRKTLSKDKVLEVCKHWLKVVGLKESDWSKRPSQLSGGMKMRASIARAMTTSPKILLMDEPFAALDDVLRSRLNDLLLGIAETEACTVVFVTHNISEAVYLSDSIGIMSQGRIERVVPILFPQKRNGKLRSTQGFLEAFEKVSDILFESSSEAVA